MLRNGCAAQVTRERIRQIEAKALLKLRHPNRSRGLRGLLEVDDSEHLDRSDFAVAVAR